MFKDKLDIQDFIDKLATSIQYDLIPLHSD